MTKRKERKSSVLGTEYTFRFATKKEDPELEKLNGYCVTAGSKLIVVEDAPGSDDVSGVRKRTSRHEIIHAFLFESGLDNEAPWADCEEQLVDWLAIQFPKLVKAMEEAEAL